MSKGKENKPHIGIFGRRNVGKSSLINVLAGQELAIVSEAPGTTTDPVKKSIEITGIGAAILIDTAGIDDIGSLGNMRVNKSKDIVKRIDVAILVISENHLGKYEKELVNDFHENKVPFIVLHNKSDIQPLEDELNKYFSVEMKVPIVDFSTINPANLDQVYKLILSVIPAGVLSAPSLLGDLVSYGDIVLLITPIDIEAPAGRLILPQVQAIRDILDNDCIAIVVKEKEVDAFLKKSGIKPKLVITDSQIFLKADAMIPKDIPLTGFSVLLARHKGDFPHYLEGTPKISELKDGDRLLLLESCTHQVSCDDIGRVKIPRWISNFTGKKLEFDVVAGLDNLPRPITDYALVIQCGGCMITRKQIINRLHPAVQANIPVTNYGMAIAYVQGIYNRAIQPFIKTDQNNPVNYL